MWHFASKFCGQSGVLKKKKLESVKRKVDLLSPGKCPWKLEKYRKICKIYTDHVGFIQISSACPISYFNHPLVSNIVRGSRPEVFFRKGVLKICSKFTWEHPCQSLISIKLLNQLYWNYTSAWVFSSKFAAHFQNNFS